MMVQSKVQLINTSIPAVGQRRAASCCLCTTCVQKNAAVTIVLLMHAASRTSLRYFQVFHAGHPEWAFGGALAQQHVLC